MTVQELIDKLNNIQDKSKKIKFIYSEWVSWDNDGWEEMEEVDNEVDIQGISEDTYYVFLE